MNLAAGHIRPVAVSKPVTPDDYAGAEWGTEEFRAPAVKTHDYKIVNRKFHSLEVYKCFLSGKLHVYFLSKTNLV